MKVCTVAKENLENVFKYSYEQTKNNISSMFTQHYTGVKYHAVHF